MLFVSSAVLASNDLSIFAVKTNSYERNFNPFNASVGSFYATDFIYEPLWIFNVWNPEKDYPRLAESVSIANDFRSVTYQLRKGVLWSDGTPFTASDVIFTVEYARKHPNLGVNISLHNAEDGNGIVTRVEALDNYTVRFELHSPSALAHQTIGKLYPLPKHIFEAIDDPANFANANPVGTGPFTEVTSFRTTSFKICRNPNYYQADSLQVDCLRVPYFSGNEEMWAAARRGKIDWFGEGLQNAEEQYSGHLPTNKYWLAPGGNVNMQLNTQKAPFNDIEFRKALSMALDRTTMVNTDTFGQTTPSDWPVGTGPLYRNWYETQTLQPYKYLMQFNPEAARQALDRAGYVDQDGDGIRELPNGQPLSIGIAVPTGWTDWFNVVLTSVKNLRDVGIQARVDGMDEQKWFQRIPSGDFDIYMMWTLPGITPFNVYTEMFNASGMEPGRIVDQAMHQFKSSKIESLLSDFELTTDLAKQKQIISDIQVEVAENLPVLTLFTNPIWYEYSTARFTGWVTEDNPYVRPQVHKGVPERLIHVLSLRPVNP
jgi:peptide/nickel transport system substrate-binding protein